MLLVHTITTNLTSSQSKIAKLTTKSYYILAKSLHVNTMAHHFHTFLGEMVGSKNVARIL